MTEKYNLTDLQFLKPSYISPYFEHYNHGKVGCYGLDLENNQIHINTWHSLNASSNKPSFPLSYILLDNGFDFRKINKQKESESNVGILKMKWLNKHVDFRPLVILIFYQLEWKSQKWQEDLCNIQLKFNNVREKIVGTDIPLLLVLIQDDAIMIIDAPTFSYQAELSTLSSTCNLSFKHCFTLPSNSAQIALYLVQIETMIVKLSFDYCNQKIIKYKEKRDESTKSIVNICKSIRLSLKSCIYFELKQDFYGALKNYRMAYTQIVESNIKDLDTNEVKILAGNLSCKIGRLCIDTGVPLDAIHQFSRFHKKYITSSFIDNLCEHYLWLCHQQTWFAKIIELASSSNLFSTHLNRHAGVYYMNAADYAIKAHNVIKTTQIKPEDVMFPVKILPPVYLGKYPQIVLPPPNQLTNEEYTKLFNTLINILNSNFDFPRFIISLLEYSLAHYKLFHSTRTQMVILNKISIQNCLINADTSYIDNEILKLSSRILSKWHPFSKTHVQRLIRYYFTAMKMEECFKNIFKLFEIYIYEKSFLSINITKNSDELFLFLSSLIQGKISVLPAFFDDNSTEELNKEISIPFSSYILNYSSFCFIQSKIYFLKSNSSNINDITVMVELLPQIPIHLLKSIVVHITHKQGPSQLFTQPYYLDRSNDECSLKPLTTNVWNMFKINFAPLCSSKYTELSIESVELNLEFFQQKLSPAKKFSLILPIKNSIRYRQEFTPFDILLPTSLNIPPSPLLDIKFKLDGDCIFNENNRISLKIFNISSFKISQLKSALTIKYAHCFNQAGEIQIWSHDPSFDATNGIFTTPSIDEHSSIILNFNVVSTFLGSHSLFVHFKFQVLSDNFTNVTESSVSAQQDFNFIFPFSIDSRIISSSVCPFSLLNSVENLTPYKISLNNTSILTEPSGIMTSRSYTPTSPTFGPSDKICLLNQLIVNSLPTGEINACTYSLSIEYYRTTSEDRTINRLIIVLHLEPIVPSWASLELSNSMNTNETDVQTKTINLSIINSSNSSLVICYKITPLGIYSNMDDDKLNIIYVHPTQLATISTNPLFLSDRFFKSVTLLKVSKIIELADAKDYFNSELAKQLKLVKL